MPEHEGPPEVRDADRVKFFTDAVVAIAMTLLILPLLEGVTEAGSDGLSTSEYLTEERGQLIAFVLSFVVIARFWIGHERLFSYVGTWTGALMTLNVGWMLTIVFLPVATALFGTIGTDRLQLAVYIGTMLLTSLLTLGMNLVVRRDARIWVAGHEPPTRGVSASITLVVLFVVAFALAVASPTIGYFGLLVLLLSGPVQRAVDRLLD